MLRKFYPKVRAIKHSYKSLCNIANNSDINGDNQLWVEYKVAIGSIDKDTQL